MADAISQRATPDLQRSARQIGPKDEARLDWLVTGFGPFPRVTKNPAAELARRLANGWRHSGLRVRAHVFETRYGAVTRDLPALAAPCPRAVLMLGVASKARKLRVEMLARNSLARGTRDAGGTLPKLPVIAPGRPAFRHGRHKGAALVLRLRAAGVAAHVSRDAGKYLCNFAYWHMLAALPEARVVFVHVPFPRGSAKGDTRPSLDDMARALRALMRGGL